MPDRGSRAVRQRGRFDLAATVAARAISRRPWSIPREPTAVDRDRQCGAGSRPAGHEHFAAGHRIAPRHLLLGLVWARAIVSKPDPNRCQPTVGALGRGRSFGPGSSSRVIGVLLVGRPLRSAIGGRVGNNDTPTESEPAVGAPPLWRRIEVQPGCCPSSGHDWPGRGPGVVLGPQHVGDVGPERPVRYPFARRAAGSGPGLLEGSVAIRDWR